MCCDLSLRGFKALLGDVKLEYSGRPPSGASSSARQSGVHASMDQRMIEGKGGPGMVMVIPSLRVTDEW